MSTLRAIVFILITRDSYIKIDAPIGKFSPRLTVYGLWENVELFRLPEHI